MAARPKARCKILNLLYARYVGTVAGLVTVARNLEAHAATLTERNVALSRRCRVRISPLG
jgi:hypothetical protein